MFGHGSHTDTETPSPVPRQHRSTRLPAPGGARSPGSRRPPAVIPAHVAASLLLALLLSLSTAPRQATAAANRRPPGHHRKPGGLLHACRKYEGLPGFVKQQNYNTVGEAFSYLPKAGYKTCAKKCFKRCTCTGFVISQDGSCWLKRKLGGLVRQDGVSTYQRIFRPRRSGPIGEKGRPPKHHKKRRPRSSSSPQTKSGPTPPPPQQQLPLGLSPDYCGDRASVVGEGNDQILQLRLDKDCGTRLRTKYRVLYGNFSARIKLPAQRSYGVSSTIYLTTTPVSETERQSLQEIDFEFLNSGNLAHVQTNWFFQGEGGHESFPGLNFEPYADFHLYRIEWSPTAMTWYVDDRVVHKVKASDHRGGYPSAPMYLAISIWSASNWLGPVDFSKGHFVTQYKDISWWGGTQYPG